MRRFWTILIVVSLSLATALSAGARVDCEERPLHPQCVPRGPDPGDPRPGTACVPSEEANRFAASENFVFTVDATTVGATDVSACVDVSDVVAGDWTVGVAVVQGTLRELLVLVRDSFAPGDLCEGIRYRKNTMPDSAFSFVLGVEVASVVNACGTEFAEMVDGEYVKEQTGAPDPLAFLVFLWGSKDLRVHFDVDIPTS